MIQQAQARQTPNQSMFPKRSVDAIVQDFPIVRPHVTAQSRTIEVAARYRVLMVPACPATSAHCAEVHALVSSPFHLSRIFQS